MGAVTIIQTTDLHGRLTMQIASRLAALKRRHDALLCDCGDALGTPNYAPAIGVEKVANVMHRAHYDVMCMGNREYGLFRQMTESKLKPFNFPVISSNLATGTPGIECVQPTAVFVHSGHTIGVWGLSPDMTPSGSLAHRVSRVQFSNPAETARKIVKNLRQTCDIVVLLLHWGHSVAEQTEFVENLTGVDLVLCGHMHVDAGSFEYINTTPLSRCGSHARQAAVLIRSDGGQWSQELVELA